MANTVNSESVAQDQIRAFIERIERMEEEKKAIADDIKEIYGEAKGNGFDVKVLRQLIRIRKQDHAERMEQEALLDLYMVALGMQSAPRDDDDDEPPRGRTRHDDRRPAALEMRSEEITSSASISGHVGLKSAIQEIIPQSPPEHTPPGQNLAAEREGDEARQPIQESASSIQRDEREVVTPSSDESVIGREAVASALPASNSPAVAEALRSTREVHVGDGGGAPIPSVGGDTDEGDSGLGPCMGAEVATLSPETAAESTAARMDGPEGGRIGQAVQYAPKAPEACTRAPPVDANPHHVSDLPKLVIADVDRGIDRQPPKLQAAGSNPAVSANQIPEPYEGPAGKPVEAEQSASTAPIPGVVYMERCPPVGIVYHDFARCFPEMFGLTFLVLVNDIEANGVKKPIVFIGNEILDGRSRYNAARQLGIDYPCVQYAGRDPLADMIRWNLTSGRLLTTAEQKTIATKLAKIPGNEHRASEIAELFGLEVEVAA